MANYGFGGGLNGLPPQQAIYMPRAFDVTISPTSVSKNTTSEQTFTVTGLNTDDAVLVTKPTTQSGLGIANARVSAANTLAIAFINAGTTAITPTASETYKVVAFKVG